MNHTITVSYDNVLIRQPVPDDLEMLRTWRNDPDNSRFLSKMDRITEEMQQIWFQGYLKDEDHCMFVCEETRELRRAVGSVSLYNFRPGICECGKIMVGDTEARGKGIGKLGIALAMYAGFEIFQVSAIDAVAYEENTASVKTLQKAGFQISGKRPALDFPGKTEVELLSAKAYFYNCHDFLDKAAIDGGPSPS